MDFRLSDEQLQIQQMVRDFAVSEIKPNLAEWDRRSTSRWTRSNAPASSACGVTIPEEYGGAGLSSTSTWPVTTSRRRSGSRS